VEAAIGLYYWEKFNVTTTKEYKAVEVESVYPNGYKWYGTSKSIHESYTVDPVYGDISVGAESTRYNGYILVNNNRIAYRWYSNVSCDNYPGCNEDLYGYAEYESQRVDVENKGSNTGQLVTSSSKSTYPSNGKHTDGYWYVYKGQNTQSVLTITTSNNQTLVEVL